MQQGDKSMQQSPTSDNRNLSLEDLDVQQTEEIKGGPSTQSKRDILLKTSLTQGTDN